MRLTNARFLRDDFTFVTGDLLIRDGRIAAAGEFAATAGEETVDLAGLTVIPGLIETHFHGVMGKDCSLGDPAVFDVFSAYLATQGITGFVPALLSSTEEVTRRFLVAGETSMRRGNYPGATMEGLYLEGPFLSQEYKGAHDPAVLRDPSPELLREWTQLAPGRVVRVIIAPELPGAEETTRWAVAHGIPVTVGHSAADCELAGAAFDNGATMVTHLFNAMSPLKHRAPGIPGAALTDDRVTCELIADFRHVAPAVVKLVCKVKGADRVCLISDSVCQTGLPDGEFLWPDGRVSYSRDGLAYLPDGTINGSTSPVTVGVRNVISLGFAPEDAIRMATLTPARTIGKDAEIGSIAVGKRANLAVTDAHWQVRMTLVDGKTVYQTA